MRPRSEERVMRVSDSTLVESIADRDVAAFEEFYRRHVGHVVDYGTRRCRDPHEVAELCAAVFLAVWERGGTFDAGRGEPRAWITGIAGNKLADLRRRDQRHEALSARLLERRVLDDDDYERLAERMEAARSVGDLNEAIDGLPDAQREVLSLGAVDGLTASEAASRLGTTPTAVRMRLSRARRSLRGAQVDSKVPADTDQNGGVA